MELLRPLGLKSEAIEIRLPRPETAYFFTGDPLTAPRSGGSAASLPPWDCMRLAACSCAEAARGWPWRSCSTTTLTRHTTCPKLVSARPMSPNQFGWTRLLGRELDETNATFEMDRRF
jgi:hypothetical protein